MRRVQARKKRRVRLDVLGARLCQGLPQSLLVPGRVGCVLAEQRLRRQMGLLRAHEQARDIAPTPPKREKMLFDLAVACLHLGVLVQQLLDFVLGPSLADEKRQRGLGVGCIEIDCRGFVGGG